MPPRKLAWVGVLFLGMVYGHVADANTLQLASPKDQANYEAHIKSTNNEKLIGLLPRMTFYSRSVIPPLFQIDEYTSFFTGFHFFPPSYREPNVFFPWKHPGGLADGVNATTFKFVIFPEPREEKRSATEKISWWRQMVPPAAFNSPIRGILKWTYPVGTIFGEVLLVMSPSGTALPFEVRIREKVSAGHSKGWTTDSYKPFPSAGDLLVRLGELMAAKEGWATDAGIKALAAYLENDSRPLVRRVLEDTAHTTKRAFGKRYALYDTLPPIAEKYVNELLTTTPFVSSVGTSWVERGNEAGANPTTAAGYHIVPRGSNLPFMFVNDGSCMNCHDTVQHHCREFSTNINGGDWYGFVRGSDAIFSLHFAATTGGNPSFMKAFVDADLLAQAGGKR